MKNAIKNLLINIFRPLRVRLARKQVLQMLAQGDVLQLTATPYIPFNEGAMYEYHVEVLGPLRDHRSLLSKDNIAWGYDSGQRDYFPGVTLIGDVPSLFRKGLGSSPGVIETVASEIVERRKTDPGFLPGILVFGEGEGLVITRASAYQARQRAKKAA